MTPAGTQITDWILTITNGATPCGSVTISNDITGETAYWGNTLAALAIVRFDSARQVVDVSTDSGATWTRTNENMNGLIPRLKGGVDNDVAVAGPTDAVINYTYTARG